MATIETIEFIKIERKELNMKLEEGISPYYGIGTLDFLLDLAISELIELKKGNDKKCQEN